MKIVGTAGADALAIVYNGSVLTGIEGGTLSGVETVTADLFGGSDTLSYGTGMTVTLNLTTHSASGFASIPVIEAKPEALWVVRLTLTPAVVPVP